MMRRERQRGRAHGDCGCPGHRPHHEVLRRCVDRDPRDGHLLRGQRSSGVTTSTSARVAAEEGDKVMPTRVHAMVLVSQLHKPTLRALAFTKATRPNVLEGVYVAADAAATTAAERVGEPNVGVPSRCCSPRIARSSSRSSSTSAGSGRPTRVESSLSISPSTSSAGGEAAAAQPDRVPTQGPAALHAGVMVTSVPYQLRRSDLARGAEERARQGSGAARCDADGGDRGVVGPASPAMARP